MPKKDIFSQNTYISESLDELVITKDAFIIAKGAPRLESHGQGKNLSNKAFGIGRDRSNMVIISDPKVSKFHATVTFKKGTGYIRDSGSTNGTYVNKKKIPPHTNIALNNNDIIILGSTKIKYIC